MDRLRFGTLLAPNILPIYQVLAVATRDGPSLARSPHIIDALGPSSIQPVAVSKRVSVGPSSYDDIRMMLEAGEAPGFMRIQ